MNMEIIHLILKLPLCLPLYLCYLVADKAGKARVDEDLAYMNQTCKKNSTLFYYLICRKPYRNLFYYRIPAARYFKFLLPQYDLFTIVSGCDIAGGVFVLNHPYATILNAKRIGKKFVCCHLTTIGNKKHGDNACLPRIGDNVSLGANVTIIGGVTIGNNVTIGAGSVVVHDLPDNCVAVGNPARIVKYINQEI